jgi:ATP-dependent protease HslVU (ClpYQ) peptidase subunit
VTCIAGVVDHGGVWIGADSASADDQWALSIVRNVKVFKREAADGTWLFGFTWSWRMGQLLEHALKLPGIGSLDLYAYMVTEFVDAVRDCLKTGGFATKDKEAESGGQFMVGHAGRLFLIHSDYQVAEPADPFTAIGCGANVALGALHALGHVEPTPRIMAALTAAERFNAGVRSPFLVKAIGP